MVYINSIQLVGGFNSSEIYYSVGMIIPKIWENKQFSKHPTRSSNGFCSIEFDSVKFLEPFFAQHQVVQLWYISIVFNSYPVPMAIPHVHITIAPLQLRQLRVLSLPGAFLGRLKRQVAARAPGIM